ncbi:MAG: TIR domain-containing protein [Burkholderiaceae bacterium]|nr:TIR domain-containing protein [Burkholderiaceae bacterium]
MRKTIFIAFAIEDEKMRDLFTGQSVHPRTPFEFIDMSVKEAYETDWKDKVRTRIRRSHGVIALISTNSTNSTGQKWEIQCAAEEGVPVVGVRVYQNDATTISGVRVIPWTWDGIAAFIDGL